MLAEEARSLPQSAYTILLDSMGAGHPDTPRAKRKLDRTDKR